MSKDQWMHTKSFNTKKKGNSDPTYYRGYDKGYYSGKSSHNKTNTVLYNSIDMRYDM